MYNLFLNNTAIDIADLTEFEEGINHLNSICIERDSTAEHFYRDENIWNTAFNFGNIADLFGTELLSPQFRNKILPVFFERGNFESIENITTIQQLDKRFSGDFNGFLGIDFSDAEIIQEKQVCSSSQFETFKRHCLSQIGFRDLWDKREELFPNLILCGEVEAQIGRIGNSSHFNQIVERLKVLDKYVLGWQTGSFSYREVNRTCNLRISPESDQTMSRYGTQRVFRLPELGSITCDLHIKTGDLRFHFYPDNETKHLYVAYIGAHLDTVSN